MQPFHRFIYQSKIVKSVNQKRARWFDIKNTGRLQYRAANTQTTSARYNKTKDSSQQFFINVNTLIIYL